MENKNEENKIVDREKGDYKIHYEDTQQFLNCRCMTCLLKKRNNRHNRFKY